jgi:hypothetical protein
MARRSSGYLICLRGLQTEFRSIRLKGAPDRAEVRVNPAHGERAEFAAFAHHQEPVASSLSLQEICALLVRGVVPLRAKLRLEI